MELKVVFDTVQSLDTQFVGAYNQCDLTTVSSMVAEDLARVLSRRHGVQCWPTVTSGWPEGKHLRGSDAGTGARYAGGLSDSALRGSGDWRPSLPSSW